MQRAGKRFPLLVYQRLFSRWRNAALLIGLAGWALWWFAPGVPMLAGNAVLDWALLAVGLLGSLLFVYTLVAPRLCFLQCRPTHWLIATPLFRLAVSYTRIRSVRPAKFVPARLSEAERDMLGSILGQTAAAVDLNAFPMPEKTLRFWLHRCLFVEDGLGFIFPARDWMELSREIEEYRAAWKVRQPA